MAFLTSTLSRYMAGIFCGWFLASLLLITTVVAFFETSELARISIGKANITAGVIVEMVILKLPQHLQLLLPFTILLATLITFWRLHHHAEMVVIRASGISVWQYVLSLGAVVGLIYAANIFVLNPLSAAMISRQQNLEALYFQGQENRVAISETGLWLRERSQNQSQIFHASSANLKKGIFSQVSLFVFSERGAYQESLSAAQGRLEKETWVLTDVKRWRGDRLESIKEVRIPTELTLEKIQQGNPSPQSISLWHIPDYIRILEKSGLSTLGYRLYWHAQFAKVALLLGMLFLGIALSLRQPLRGFKGEVVVGALIAGFLTYFINDVVYALGLADKIPVILAAWGPGLILAFLSATALLHFEDG